MSWISRQREEQLLFAYWKGVNRVVPNFTDATIVEGFILDFGHICEECGTEILLRRLGRMKKEYIESTNE